MSSYIRVITTIVAISLLLVAAKPANAQETRSETIPEQQAGKQNVVAPPRRNRVEVMSDRLEDWGVLTGEPRGFYPWFGSVFYICLEISAMGGPKSWAEPVLAYFRREPGEWRLVGFERMPDGTAVAEAQSGAPE